jgi:triacylglycerol lipase
MNTQYPGNFPRSPLFPLLLAATLLVAACAAPKPAPCPEEGPVNYAEALDLAWKSETAYRPDSEIIGSCGIDHCIVITGETTGARAYVQRDDENHLQWVAFRGTRETSGVRLDAGYVRFPDPELDVPLHEGFAAGAAELFPELAEHLRPGYHTWFTGHGLGGAMAVITALRMERLGIRPRVITFGQPKVTSVAGARAADTLLDLTRFVRGRDVMAQVPPVSWVPDGRESGSYAHFGREVVIDADGADCRRPAPRLDFPFWRDPVRLEALQEHHLAGYLDLLEKLLMESLDVPEDLDIDEGDGSEGAEEGSAENQ